MKFNRTLLSLGIALAMAGCNDDDNANTGGTAQNGGTPVVTDPVEPVFSAARFGPDSADISNPHIPLIAGTGLIYEGLNEDGELERVEIFVSHETKTIAGVESRIVVDRAYVDGELGEETFDWYAQDRDGNVWYMGEASTDFEDGVPISTSGSWEAGKDIAAVGTTAVAGILFKAGHQVGDTYQQEFYPSEAEDMAEIVSINAAVTLEDGSQYNTVQTREWNPLDQSLNEEYKYYAPGIGLVVESKLDGTDRVELVARTDDKTPGIKASDFSNPTQIDNPFLPLIPGTTQTYQLETDDGLELTVIEVLDQTREVMGIEARVVRDRVYLDDLLIEDTRDWFAQDDEGGVWYLGEDVDNYEYDDLGNIVSIDHHGAWEAGVDGAQPGIQMLLDPRVGDSYRQEYLKGRAEDMAAVVAHDVVVTLASGATFHCLKTKDWNPLEEGAVEFKYYAPGIGLVMEEDVDGEERLELVSGD
ncbi:MAG: hypothetical protein MI864_27710 [Pseudomonadales bacterium]|nr:hypothetical protein [Pseudomonadales bacterium]